VTTLPEAKLDTLLTRHAMVEAELSRQLPPETFVKLSREFAEIDPVVARSRPTARSRPNSPIWRR